MKPIYLKLSVPTDKLATGSSRFWGNPDLPEDFDFPSYTDDDGEEYDYVFVCQINLEELANFGVPTMLPKRGLLSFFAKIDHYMGYYDVPMDINGCVSNKDAVRVLYFPNCMGMVEKVLVGDDDKPIAPHELRIDFTRHTAAVRRSCAVCTSHSLSLGNMGRAL